MNNSQDLPQTPVQDSTTSQVQPVPQLSPFMLVATVLIVAATLRAPINAVGPILPEIGQALQLSATSQGFLGALPVLSFAVVSPFVPWLSKPWGYQKTVWGSLVIVAVGIVVRSIALPGFIWVGTALLSGGIAVGAVLLPAIIKVNFAHNTAMVTAAYSATMGLFSALAGAVAVPLERQFSWSIAVGIWVLLTGLALIAWLPRLMRPPIKNPNNPSEADDPGYSMWKSPLAWWVALFMGMQSAMSYLINTWIPTIEQSLGVSAQAAGWHLAVNIVLGNVAGFVAAPAIQKRRDVRGVAVVVSSIMIVGTTGLYLTPQFAFFWVVCIGLSSGIGFVLALNLMATRGKTMGEAGRLSAMSQGVGYAIAALGPWLAGVIYDATLKWGMVLMFLLTLACIQLICGLFAGRDRYTRPPSSSYAGDQ